MKISNILDISERHYRAIELGTRGTTTENWLKLYKLFNEKISLDKLMENTTIDDLLEQDVKKNK